MTDLDGAAQDADSGAQWDHRYAKDSAWVRHGVGRVSYLEDIVPSLGLPEQPRCAVDVGCGTGEDARWLADAGFRAVGIDVSGNALKIAAERTPSGTDVEWLVGTATTLPTDDASCVLVTDRGCLHHVAPGDVPAYVSEIVRVVVPGGAWVICDMVSHGQHHRELDSESIHDLSRDSALEVEKCEISDAGTHKVMNAVLRRL